jgi:hypothetical protein
MGCVGSDEKNKKMVNSFERKEREENRISKNVKDDKKSEEIEL